MSHLRIAALLVLGVCLIGVALVGRGAGAPPQSRQMTFEDRRTGQLLTVETDVGSPEAGRFSLRVPGRGTFLGVERADLRSNGGEGTSIVIVRYDGDVDVITPEGTTRAYGRLQGRLDLDHHTAEATLWFGSAARGTREAEPPESERFHMLAVSPSLAGLREAADAFRSAMLAGDWAGVYDIASADLRGADGQADFVATALAQAPDRIARLDVSEIGDPSTHPLGISFAIVRMNALHEGPAGSRAVAYDVYFVLEGSDWKLWFTVER